MKVIKEKLLDTKAFKKTFNKPKKAAEDYGSARDIKDENKASSKDFAFMCDVSSVYTNEKTGATKAGKIEEYLFRKGQTFCDSKTGKAFTCEDAIKCAEAATDPSKADANKQKTDAFKKIWKEVAADKTKGKMFFTKKDRTPRDGAGKVKPTKAYDWTKTTKSDFTGTYTIKSGDLSYDATAKRIYKCRGKPEECQKTQPSKDADGKIWQIT